MMGVSDFIARVKSWLKRTLCCGRDPLLFGEEEDVVTHDVTPELLACLTGRIPLKERYVTERPNKIHKTVKFEQKP